MHFYQALNVMTPLMEWFAESAREDSSVTAKPASELKCARISLASREFCCISLRYLMMILKFQRS
jgi:hypothetical protein